MNSDIYYTIDNSYSGEYKEKGSKFIGYAAPVDSEADFKAFMERIKKAHHQARHHCFAYRLSPESGIYRSSDDREPSGSAGKPILGQIQSKELFNVAVIVVRYFGGTLLGVPGLIRSYRAGAEAALDNATIIERHVEVKFRLLFNYEDTSEVRNQLSMFEHRILEQEFDQRCEMHFSVLKSKAEELEQRFENNHLISEKINLSRIDE